MGGPFGMRGGMGAQFSRGGGMDFMLGGGRGMGNPFGGGGNGIDIQSLMNGGGGVSGGGGGALPVNARHSFLPIPVPNNQGGQQRMPATPNAIGRGGNNGTGGTPGNNPLRQLAPVGRGGGGMLIDIFKFTFNCMK
jgi:hypothetical protein